jgi:phage terminase small subunit
MAVQLSPRRERFVQEYLKDRIGAQAAIRAGYSPRGADRVGSRLLGIVEVQERIRELAATSEMSGEEIIERLTLQARGAHGEYIHLNDLRQPALDLEKLKADGLAHLLKGFSVSPKGVRYEFYDAQAALIILGKSKGVLTDRTTEHVDQERFEEVAGRLMQSRKERGP